MSNVIDFTEARVRSALAQAVQEAEVVLAEAQAILDAAGQE